MSIRTQINGLWPKPSAAAQTGLLQRKCDSCGNHTVAGRECRECSKGTLRRKAANNSSHSEVPPIVNEVLRSPGQPLDASTRAFFEPRFSRDFSSVRIHTDAKAAESAASVKALAYTVGRNVVFGNRRYMPHTVNAKHLLAHELAHVIQQGSGNTLVQPALAIGNAGDKAEKEADQSAHSVMNGDRPETISTTSTNNGVLQRAETDTSGGCSDLKDTKADVNNRINQALDNARTKSKAALEIIKSFYKELGENKDLGYTKIEGWAKSLDKSKIRKLNKEETKYAGVNYNIWLGASLGLFPVLSPIMRIKNICVGSDKLGHFLQQGHQYLQIKQNTNKFSRGLTRLAPVGYGIMSEIGHYGMATTGVFSNADLEANRQGVRFYEDLIADPSMKMDIGQYVNSQWNEENNPNSYQNYVGKKVWRNLLNGNWSGTFTPPAASKSYKVLMNLTGADDETTLSGVFAYVSDNGKVTNGYITKGRITHLKSLYMNVTRIKIDFDWKSGAASGKGLWVSEKESGLEGTWG